MGNEGAAAVRLPYPGNRDRVTGHPAAGDRVTDHPITGDRTAIAPAMTSTLQIHVNTSPSQDDLERLGVSTWPIWTKDVSEFPWTYDEAETCYILAGAVTVIPDGGEPVVINTGDLVTFPAGMGCTWRVTAPIRKHYRFG